MNGISDSYILYFGRKVIHCHPYLFIYYRYIIGISEDGVYINMLHKSKNLARILVYKIWVILKNQCLKCMLQKQKKIFIFLHKITFYKFTIYRYRYRPIWQLLYRHHNRYQPIWKSEISVVISIGRYEKGLSVIHYSQSACKYQIS